MANSTRIPGRFTGSFVTLYVDKTNPYRKSGPIHGVYPTVTLDEADLRAWIWFQFEESPVLTLAYLKNEVGRLAPVGCRLGNNATETLRAMVDEDKTLILTRQGGYPAYRRA